MNKKQQKDDGKSVSTKGTIGGVFSSGSTKSRRRTDDVHSITPSRTDTFEIRLTSKFPSNSEIKAIFHMLYKEHVQDNDTGRLQCTYGAATQTAYVIGSDLWTWHKYNDESIPIKK